MVASASARVALAQPTFQILDLGTLGGTKSEAYDVNASGQVVGFAKTAAGANHAFRTAANSAINPLTDDLGTLTGGTSASASAIDSSGRVTGYSASTSGDRAFRYSAGVMSNLGTFNGNWSYGYGINYLGNVVGGAATNQNRTHAFLYNGTTKYDLGAFTNTDDSWGQAINGSGTVVGYGGTANFVDHAFKWVPTVTNGTSGTMSDLGTLGGSSSYAWAINDNGVIVGASNTLNDAEYHAFQCVGAVKTDLGTLGGTYSEAFDVNLAGKIVGAASDGGGNDRAFLYSAGSMYDLNSLTLQATGWTLQRARGINDSDQIVGYGLSPSGDVHGFLLTPVPAWNVNADGAWSTSANWAYGVPNAAGKVAILGSAITAPHTVTADVPSTVGSIRFDNANSYTIGGLSITLSAAAGGSIEVINGSHTIAAPLILASDTTINIAPAVSTLTLSGDMSGAGALTKTGAGNLVAKHVRAAALTVSQGSVMIAPNGTSAGASKIGSLYIASGAKLDLTNNKLVTTTAAGGWTGSSYDGVTGLIQSGRNGGNWGGNGIVTSQTVATTGNLTSIGVATAAQATGIATTATTIWAGQTVSGSDTLVMYTYGGDANLDGKINVDDYTRIDFNVPLGSAGWYNGDFNYDGKINVDDYTIIDFNVGIQGSPFSTASDVSISATAVPEPPSAMLGLTALGLCAGGIARRRCR